jgi:SAM-dependent methyltransferase
VSGKFVNRFTGRAEAYSKYRPTYPREIIDILNAQIGFSKEKIVADVGSGTGILTKIFLDNGNRVFGIEPNDEMRSFAEKNLSNYANFVSMNQSAEKTDLSSNSIDLVTAGQALHWFDPDLSRAEFARILKPSGYVMIVYNERGTGDGGVMDGYEKLINKNAKASVVPDIDAEYLAKFFNSKNYREFTVPNKQVLDFEALVGRAASASYLPTKNDPGYDNMKQDLRRLFDTYQVNGLITIIYATTIFLGQILT